MEGVLKPFHWNSRGLQRISKRLATLKPPVIMVTLNESTRVLKLSRDDHEPDVLSIMHAVVPKHTVRIQGMLKNIMILEYLPPFIHNGVRMPTLDSLLDNVKSCERIVADVIFQVASILSSLRERHPNFCHNDLKADNIMLTPNTEELSPGYCPPVRVVFIDVETVTADDIAFKPDADEGILEDFGLGANMPECEWSDFHLVMLEIWVRVRNSRPSWGPEFLKFMLSIVPYELMKTYQDGSPHVSRMNRLTREGRRACNSQCAPLREVIQSEYLLTRIHGCSSPSQVV